MTSNPSTPPSKATAGPRPLAAGLRRLGERVRRVPAAVAWVWSWLLERPTPWVALWLAVGLWGCLPGRLFFSPVMTSGMIAERDFVATHDLLLPDAEATAAKREGAKAAVLPVYDLDPSVAGDRDKQLAALFAEGRKRLAEIGDVGGTADPAASRQALASELAAEAPSPQDLRLLPAQAELLVEKGFSEDLEERVRGSVGRALRHGVVANKALLLENRINGVLLRNLETGAEQIHFDLYDHLGHPEEVRDFLETEVREWPGVSSGQRRLLVELMVANVPLNLHLNQSETLARRERAAAAAGEVYVQLHTGQVIARRGDALDARQASLIAQMVGRRPADRQWPTLAGTLALLALAAAVLGLGLARERVADHSRGRLLTEALLLLTLAVAIAKVGVVIAGALSSAFESPSFSSWQSYAFALPWAWLALVAALLLGRHTALLLAALASLLVGRMTGGDSSALVLYSFAGSLAAVLALDRYQFRQRLVTARVGLWVAAVNSVMVLILGAFAEPVGKSASGLAFDVLCAVMGGILVAAIASFALPTLEALFGITTDIRLVELSNTNLPLLRRLAFEAPGTFQHSLMVANLAKEGCEAVGADPILAYAASLYHDVGKMLRPDYFIENQRPGHNRHDRLQPSMSALILVSHVKDGLELARQYGLPRALKDAIEQHHGTRLMRYFYNKAVEQRGPEGGEVREEKYRYPGPKPQNKVMAILMLADGVEAASRTLVDPNPTKIRELIRQIFEACRLDGQLEQTDLTLSDLRLVGEAFHRLLATVFHQRVDYPGFDFNHPARRDPRTITGTAGNVIRMRRE